MKHSFSHIGGPVVLLKFVGIGLTVLAILLDLAWVIPALAGMALTIAGFGIRFGYLDSVDDGILNIQVSVACCLFAAASLGAGPATTTTLLFSALPLLATGNLVRRIPSALLGTMCFLMLEVQVFGTPLATFSTLVLASLVAPEWWSRSGGGSASRSTSKLISSSAAKSQPAELGVTPGTSGGPSKRDALKAILSLTDASAAALYRRSGDGETSLQASVTRDGMVSFGDTIPAHVTELIGDSRTPRVWYRAEQLSPTRTEWFDSQNPVQAVAFSPVVLDGIRVGFLAFVYGASDDWEREGLKQFLNADAAREIRDTLRPAAELLTEFIDADRRNEIYERERHEYQIITNAADTLSRAQTTEASLRIIIQLLRDLTSSDAIALYRYDARDGNLIMQQLETFDATASVPKSLDGSSLVAEACRRGHWLPYREDEELAPSTIFGREETRFPHESLLILPLTMEGESLGAIVLGSDAPALYQQEIRWRLRLVVSYLTFACSSIWRYEDTLEEATRDPLTGLLNRRSFMREAELALARQQRGGTSSAILMLDIDHFKRVNDTWGHQAGDEVIVAFADEISSHVRKTDIAGRYGGEEFIVYLEDTDADGAFHLAERIRSGIGSRVFTFDGEDLKVTTSGGIYCIDNTLETNLSSAIDRADKALYEAKDSGRDQVRLFNLEDLTRG